jgi:hypothetical protein
MREAVADGEWTPFVPFLQGTVTQPITDRAAGAARMMFTRNGDRLFRGLTG